MRGGGGKGKISGMLTVGFKADKCKTSLRMAIARIKLLKNRKEEQIRVARRELAQLLQAGQNQTARIRVEHVIREEKFVTAYELLDIYCNLILQRLPIIESQKNCPLDVKEAIAGLIFSSPRCAEAVELADIRKHFSAKYGKDFVNASLELRPDSGVNTLLVEKLSVLTPDVQTKITVLTSIAQEHNVEWDSEAFRDELQLQNNQTSGFIPSPDQNTMSMDPYTHQTPSAPYVAQPTPFPEQIPPRIPFNSDTNPRRNVLNSAAAAPAASVSVIAAHEEIRTFNEQHLSPSKPTVSNAVSPGDAGRPGVRTPTNSSYLRNDSVGMVKEEDVRSDERNLPNSASNKNIVFRDASHAALVAAKSAEMASIAVKAALELSKNGSFPGQRTSSSYESSGKISEDFHVKQPGQPFEDSNQNQDFDRQTSRMNIPSFTARSNRDDKTTGVGLSATEAQYPPAAQYPSSFHSGSNDAEENSDDDDRSSLGAGTFLYAELAGKRLEDEEYAERDDPPHAVFDHSDSETDEPNIFQKYSEETLPDPFSSLRIGQPSSVKDNYGWQTHDNWPSYAKSGDSAAKSVPSVFSGTESHHSDGFRETGRMSASSENVVPTYDSDGHESDIKDDIFSPAITDNLKHKHKEEFSASPFFDDVSEYSKDVSISDKDYRNSWSRSGSGIQDIQSPRSDKVLKNSDSFQAKEVLSDAIGTERTSLRYDYDHVSSRGGKYGLRYDDADWDDDDNHRSTNISIKTEPLLASIPNSPAKSPQSDKVLTNGGSFHTKAVKSNDSFRTKEVVVDAIETKQTSPQYGYNRVSSRGSKYGLTYDDRDWDDDGDRRSTNISVKTEPLLASVLNSPAKSVLSREIVTEMQDSAVTSSSMLKTPSELPRPDTPQSARSRGTSHRTRRRLSVTAELSDLPGAVRAGGISQATAEFLSSAPETFNEIRQPRSLRTPSHLRPIQTRPSPDDEQVPELGSPPSATPGNDSSNTAAPSSSTGASHVHPNLPEADSFAAYFQRLKQANRR